MWFRRRRARRGYLEDSCAGKATFVRPTSQTLARLDLLFVYGTLQRGFAAHHRLCGNAIFVTTAAVRGRLHLHPHGYPVLALPASSLAASRDWRWIRGEILRLRDPARALARIDAYEGVIAGVPGLYRRVRVAVRGAGVRLAWTYAAASPREVAQLPAHPADAWP
jgi:gamma-glutamylcyclotransferase (GGCT)/AIG2-like uncharacterized protein YtfP